MDSNIIMIDGTNEKVEVIDRLTIKERIYLCVKGEGLEPNRDPEIFFVRQFNEPNGQTKFKHIESHAEYNRLLEEFLSYIKPILPTVKRIEGDANGRSK